MGVTNTLDAASATLNIIDYAAQAHQDSTHAGGADVADCEFCQKVLVARLWTPRSDMLDELPALDEPYAWAGQSAEIIRARWQADDPFADDAGATRIRPEREQPILEALRHARNDIGYLLALVDCLAARAQR